MNGHLKVSAGVRCETGPSHFRCGKPKIRYETRDAAHFRALQVDPFGAHSDRPLGSVPINRLEAGSVSHRGRS